MTTHDHQHPTETSMHQHEHDHTHSHGNPFIIPFVLILVFAFIEFFGAIWTQSLALLGDAWHMLSDVFALGLAMYAAHRSNLAKAKNRQTRADLIASVLNALLMLFVTVWIVIEAIERLKSPQAVTGGYVMIIALIGLLINVIVARQLHHHEGGMGINHQAAFLHVIGDILGSLAALIAGAVVYFTGWLPIDPILSLFISVLLFLGTIHLIKNIWHSVHGRQVNSHHGHKH